MPERWQEAVNKAALNPEETDIGSSDQVTTTSIVSGHSVVVGLG